MIYLALDMLKRKFVQLLLYCSGLRYVLSHPLPQNASTLRVGHAPRAILSRSVLGGFKQHVLQKAAAAIGRVLTRTNPKERRIVLTTTATRVSRVSLLEMLSKYQFHMKLCGDQCTLHSSFFFSLSRLQS
jgi:hypothetical protein